MKSYNKITFGLPVSPSTRLSQKEIKVTKILISYGGGMGGANETHYAKKVVQSEGNVKITTFDGRTIDINPRFIVYKEPCRILEIVTDVTAHTNYHGYKVKKEILTEYVEIPFLIEKIEFKNEFGSGNLPSILSLRDIS